MYDPSPFHQLFLLALPLHPRLACILVLQSKFGGCLSVMGIACSTWVSISRGSTFRSIFLPMGHPHSLAVYRANKSVARTGVSMRKFFKDFFWMLCGLFGSQIRWSPSSTVVPYDDQDHSTCDDDYLRRRCSSN